MYKFDRRMMNEQNGAATTRREAGRRPRARIGSALVAAVAALGLAACGSTSNSSTSSAGGATTSSAASAAASSGSTGAASGSPIQVATVGPFSSPGTLNFKDQEQTAQAAVSAINASGGINGHKLSLTTCDDQFLPNKAVGCYQQAVQDKGVVAEVGGYELNGDAVKTIVDSGKLPVIGDTSGSSEDLTDPNWFNPTASQNQTYYGAGAWAASFGGKTVGVIDENLPTTHFLYSAIDQGFKAGGGQKSVQVQVTQATVDLTSTIAKLVSMHPDAVVFAVTALQGASAVQLLRQSGFKGPMFVNTGLDDAQTVAKLFKYGNTYGVDLLPSAFDTHVPGVAAFTAAINKYQPGTVINSYALSTWLSFQVLKDVASTIRGQVTRSSLMQALNSTTTLDTQGLTPDVPGWFTKPGHISSAPRIVNTDMTRLTYNGRLLWDGKFYPGR